MGSRRASQSGSCPPAHGSSSALLNENTQRSGGDAPSQSGRRRCARGRGGSSPLRRWCSRQTHSISVQQQVVEHAHLGVVTAPVPRVHHVVSVLTALNNRTRRRSGDAPPAEACVLYIPQACACDSSLVSTLGIPVGSNRRTLCWQQG